MNKEGFVKTGRTVAGSLVPRLQTFILLCCFLALPALATAGIINTVAGTGTAGYSGDGGVAVSADLNYPWGVAAHEDAGGNLYIYIADYRNNRVRMVDSVGNIQTVAGNGTRAFGGDGGLPTDANLNYPFGVAVDGSGTLYIADTYNSRIRKVTPGGDGLVNGGADEIITTVAGTETGLLRPYDVTVDGSGNLFIADTGNHCVRRVDSGTGAISVFAGIPGSAGFSGDGSPAVAAQLNTPAAVTLDDAGNLYIADRTNNRIRKVDASGDMFTVAGDGVRAYGGDGGSATAPGASLYYPFGVAFGGGNLYIADYGNHRIRMVDAVGDISTVAGNGSRTGSGDPPNPLGDGGEATAGSLYNPTGVAVAPSGIMLVADLMNHRIRSVEGEGPAPNIPPTADAQNLSLDEDVRDVAITLTGTDSDGLITSYETDPATVAGVVLLPHGTMYGTGADRTYTPDENYNGTDSFTFRVIDNNDAASDWATVSITVNSVNDPPVAGDDSATTDEDTEVVVAVLAGDSDVEDGTPSGAVSVSTPPSNGTAEVNADRTVTYTPSDEYSGPDSFTYTVLDADGDASNEATVTVTVTAVNDVPVIDGQTGALETAEESPLTVVLGDLTVTDPDNAYPDDFILSLQDGDNYSVSGTTVTPDVDFVGTLTVPATVNDGAANSAPFNLSISVSNINDAPVAGDDSAATDEDIPVTVTVLDNDADAEDGSPPVGAVTVAAVPVNGTVEVNGDRTVTYTPNPGFSGIDTFSYTVLDADGVESNEATVTVSVTGVNDPPLITAQAGPLATAEEVALTVTLADLTVSDSDTVYPGDFTLSVLAGADYGVSGATVTPDADFNGTLTVPVTVNDGIDDSNVFNLSVSVTPVNDPPVIVGQAPLSVDEEATLTVTLGDLSVTDPDNAYPDGYTLTLQSGANYTLDGTTVTPVVDFAGNLTVPVTVNDGSAESASFDLTVSVVDVNDLPVAADDSATVEEDGFVVIEVLSNDTDVEDGIPAGAVVAVDPPNGAVTVTAERAVEYVPHPQFSGLDFFTYTVLDADGGVSDEATVMLTVTAVNDPPVIDGQAAPLSTEEDTPITISFGDLLVTDPDNAYPDGFTLQLLTGANYSVAAATVTPAPDYNGPLNVSVLISDGTDWSDPAVVAVDVTPVNDPPVANPDVLDCDENASTTASVAANDTDAEEGGATGSVEIVSAPARGSVVVNGDRSVTYTPDAGFDGVDTFEYLVRDGEGAASNTATATVTVTGVNDPPVITGQAVPLTIPEEADLEITMDVVTVSDPDDDYPAGFSLTVLPGANYSVAGTVVTPDAGSVGVLTVQVSVNDGTADSNTFDLSIDVTSNNVAPTIAGQKPLGTPAETPLTIALDDLVVVDPDNLYPGDFTLSVQDGTDYSRSGNQITPLAGYSGLLTVPVTVHDGRAESEAYSLKVNVGASALFIDVDAGGTHTAGIMSDGTLWAWGNNGNGQLGYDTATDDDDSSATSSAVRQQVGTDTNWMQASLGLYHSLALKADGSLWAWGRNIEGQLGDGTGVAKDIPTLIGGEMDWVAIVAGEKHSVALKADGTLWAWGNNNKGQLGQGDTVARNVPSEVDADSYDPLTPWVAVAAGGSYTLALKADGSLWAWGDNWHGQLGVGTTEDNYLLPQPVGDPAAVWKRVAADYGHSFAIDADGALWGWGDNAYGQLGDGTTDEKLVPTQVSTETWTAVTAGHYFSAAIRGDGTLWTWGANDYGQLGSGGSLGLFRSSPEQVGVATDWVDVDGGNYHLAALQADGNLTVWGSNQNGQLGNGTRNDSVGRTVLFDNYTTPTNIGTQFISGLVTEDGVPGDTIIEIEMAYVDDAGNSIVEPVAATFDPGAGFWSADLIFSVETSYTVTVTASSPDPDDIYTGEAERVIVYDATAPGPPSVSSSIDGEAGVALTANYLPTWTWKGDAADGNGTFRYKLDDNTFGPADTGNEDVLYIPASALEDGSYTLYVQERDAAGNWSDSGSFAITVDTTPPARPDVSSLVDGVVGVTDTNVSSPTWTWSGAGGGGFGYRRSLNGGTWSAETMAISFTPGPLNEGTHTLAVQERDEVGNWSDSGSFAITIDITPPTLDAIADIPITNDSSVFYSGFVETGATLDASVDTGATTDLSDMGGMWFCTVADLAYGDNLLTLTATDAAGNTTVRTATIYRNNPPSTSGLAPVTVDEDATNTTVDLTAAFDDVEDTPSGLTYSVTNNSDGSLVGATVTGGTLTLDYVENANGTSEITVRATDSGDGFSTSYVESPFVVTVNPVNDAPTISGAPIPAVVQGDAYAFIPSAGDVDSGDVLTFSVSGAPAWATFDTVTGALGGTPGNDDVGVASGIVITVTDSAAASASLPPFDLEVRDSNDPPTIGGEPATSVAQDGLYSFEPEAVDVDAGDVLTFSVSGAPSWMTINSETGELSGTPSNDDVGVTSGIVITVTDLAEASASLPPFDLEVTDVNDPPTISGEPVATVTTGTLYNFTPEAADVDAGAELTFSASVVPAWATFDPATGELSGTPSLDDVGTTSGIVISVSDGELSASLPAFDLAVESGNSAPIISGVPEQIAYADRAYSFEPTAVDSDGDDLTFSISTTPSWASFDESTGALTGTPSVDDVLDVTERIVITVTDSAGASASLEAFSLSVLEANYLPVISGTPATIAVTERLYRFVPSATDAEGDVLAFSINASLPWASFDTSTGELSGTPSSSDIGTVTGIVITVTDTAGGSASLPAFDLVVRDNVAPEIVTPLADRMGWEGLALSLTIPVDTFADGDPGDVLTLTADGPDWLNFEVDEETGDGTLWAPATDTAFGTYTVAVTATDATGTSSAPATFTLRVARISPVQDAALEWGSIEIAPGETLTVPLAKEYINPVVVARSEASGDGFGFVQVKAEVGASSFEVRYVADSGTKTTLFYLVAEKGVQNLGGLTVQAGTVASGASVPQWQAVTFPLAFTESPAVFASVQSDAVGGPAFARVHNLSRTGLELAMQDADGAVEGTETLGWIAIEEGLGKTADDRTVLVLKTTASDDKRWYDFRDEYGSYYFATNPVSVQFSNRYQELTTLLGEQSYAESFSAPYMHMLGSLTSANDADPAILRFEELGSTRVQLSIQEGTPGGAHTTEDVSIFVAQ